MTTKNPKTDNKKRCAWGTDVSPLYTRYHDTEWGVPVHDDLHHFEMLVLEGAQAGLSWETILRRREGYRKIFKGFDPAKVARMTDKALEVALSDTAIIRNRLKVYGARKNARVFLNLQKEFGSFDAYVWSFVRGRPLQTGRKAGKPLPAFTAESTVLSKDLKKRGMTFVGKTIIYAYMQAIGMVNDHETMCFCHAKLCKKK